MSQQQRTCTCGCGAAKYQALTCKKCGESNLYHPTTSDDTGTWHRLDNFDNLQSFEEGFQAPHWYICPATTQGSDHREKMMEEMSEFKKRSLHKKEMDNIDKMRVHPAEQTKLPSEKLTPIDRDIAAKLVVMEMCLDDIKRLLAQKAAEI